MPRNSDEPCILCGELPCNCTGRKGARRTRVAPKAGPPEPLITPAQPLPNGLRAAMKAASVAGVTTPPSPEPASAATMQRTGERPNITLTDDQVIIASAIRALHGAGLLASDVQREHSSILSTEPSLEERKRLWQLRREQHG